MALDFMGYIHAENPKSPNLNLESLKNGNRFSKHDFLEFLAFRLGETRFNSNFLLTLFDQCIEIDNADDPLPDSPEIDNPIFYKVLDAHILKRTISELQDISSIIYAAKDQSLSVRDWYNLLSRKIAPTLLFDFNKFFEKFVEEGLFIESERPESADKRGDDPTDYGLPSRVREFRLNEEGMNGSVFATFLKTIFELGQTVN